jgi:ubiquinone/menaquinone biosynthesis C-methylase UbiE
MDHREVGRLWNENAAAWTKLARMGYDVYRDHLNTPAFMRMLPDVDGLHGLDIGCGEGHNTRTVAARGARMTGIDIAEVFIARASEKEAADPLGIEYIEASAVELPFADASFDFAVAFMSMMDIPENDVAIREAARVIKPGGFLQFSITHPCTEVPYRRNLRDEHGRTYALELGGYFDREDGHVLEWLFGAAPKEAKEGLKPFKTPRFHRTLSEWLSAVIDAGLAIERIEEPRADDEAVARCEEIQDTQVMPYFLHVRGRK